MKATYETQNSQFDDITEKDVAAVEQHKVLVPYWLTTTNVRDLENQLNHYLYRDGIAVTCFNESDKQAVSIRTDSHTSVIGAKLVLHALDDPELMKTLTVRLKREWSDTPKEN